MKLADRVVVVTGAGSGIGRATALAFANQGARIAACDVDQARLDQLASELGARALVVRKVDVSDRDQMSAFADAVHAQTPSGAVDVIVNNAGVAVGGTFLEISLDDWDWIIGINLRGVVHGCHFFIPKMVERAQGGHVINISSILGIYPAPTVTAYVATKFAVLGMSQSLRIELAPHRIGVTAICPGLINTQIVADGRVRGMVGERREQVKATFRKGASPERVATAILDAVRTNPAVRTVGRDAAVIATLARFAPGIGRRLTQTLHKRFGAG